MRDAFQKTVGGEPDTKTSAAAMSSTIPPGDILEYSRARAWRRQRRQSFVIGTREALMRSARDSPAPRGAVGAGLRRHENDRPSSGGAVVHPDLMGGIRLRKRRGWDSK